MFERISYTWSLMQASWAVLKRDKTLALFPLFSSIACLLVVASFATPLFFVPASVWNGFGGHFSPEQKVLGWAYLFVFYFANYFVITFFNVGIVACALTSMNGAETSFSAGIRAAMQRAHLIAGWALLSATVGLALKLVESYNKKFGRFIAGLLGAAWTIMTFLVVPVLVVENKGPVDALKESAVLLKKTWGTQLVGNFSFGLIFSLLMLPGVLAIMAAFMLAAGVSSVLGVVLIGVAVLYILALSLIQSALHSIFQGAIYMYTQGVPDETRAFSVQLLRGAIRPTA